MTLQVPVGSTPRPQVYVVDRNGAPLTGATIVQMKIRRDIDDAYWDFGGTPQFRTSGWTTRVATLTEVDATLDPGWYRLAAGWPTAGLPAGGYYLFTYTDSAGISGTAGNLPAYDDAQLVYATASGTAQAGATSSITLASTATTTDNLYQFSDLEITGGTGTGQTRSVLVYVGSSKIAYVNRPWNVVPDSTSTYAIRARTQPIIVDAALAQAGGSSSITLSAASSSVTDFYVGCEVEIAAGTGIGGQPRIITAYNGTTKVATLASAWATQPDSTSVYVLLPVGRSITVSNLDKTGYSLSAGSVALSTFAAGAIDSTVLAPNAIGASQIANNAITAAKVATDAIGAAQLASDAVAEITTGVLSTAVPGGFAVGTLGNTIGTMLLAPNALQTGTAQAGATSSITLAAGASSSDNLYRHCLVEITAGTGAGQARSIAFYVGSSKIATVTKAWLVAPDATSVYAVLPAASDLVLASGTAQAGATSTITLASTSSAVDDLYKGETITITAGLGAGQEREIASYVGATKVATVDEAWATQPDTTSVYEIVPVGRVRVASLEAAALTSITTGLALTTDVTSSTSTITTAITTATTTIDAHTDTAVATVPAATLDLALVGHTTAGTVGKALSLVDVASSTLATSAALTTAKAAIDAANVTLAAIQGGSWSSSTDTLRALRAAVDAAQADLTAIKGAGFTAGTDDLHSARAALTAAKAAIDTANATLAAIEGGSFSGTTDSLHALRAALDAAATASATATAAVQADIILIKGTQFTTACGLDNIFGNLKSVGDDITLMGSISGVLNTIGSIVAGSTFTDIHTDDTSPDDKWKDQQIFIQDTSGVHTEGFARNIVSHTGGVFIVAPPLPQLPGLDDPVRILAVVASATPSDVTAAAAAVVVAPGGIGTSSLATDALSTAAVSAGAASKIAAAVGSGIGPATLADGALTAAAIGSGFVSAITAGLSTLDGPAAAAAVWNALLASYAGANSFGAFVQVLPNAAAIASAVWAVSDGTMTKGAALDLLRRRTTNRRLMSILGVLSFFADDGVTVEKTSTVLDVNNAPVSPVSGEAAQASAEV